MTKVIVALSGGVDSSVSAAQLVKQGYQVEALFMKNWEGEDKDDYCAAAQDLSDARAVCEQLSIPLHTINFAAEYWDRVFEHFLAEYRAGRTPNPDILCNKLIKFDLFLEFALEALQGAYIATGHYARLEKTDEGIRLLRGLDPHKDQSYFLCQVRQQQLDRVLFPVGALPKTEVRAIAASLGLPTATKRDSTGICFIGEQKFQHFLSRYIPAQPGFIEDVEGNVLGEHQGLMYYTLGQRKGLGIGGQLAGTGAPWYVAEKLLDRNVLRVVQGSEAALLYSSGLYATEIHWFEGAMRSPYLDCTAKIRYRQEDVAVRVEPVDTGTLHVRFNEPQFAVTPGQSVVFYKDEYCLGGAIIVSTYRSPA